MATIEGSLTRFWAKARPSPDAAHRWHPLIWHCIDVAAAGEALLRTRPWLARELAASLRVPIAAARRTLPFLLALHDIGKLLPVFQAKVPELWPEPVTGRDPGHGSTGLALLRLRIADALDPVLPGWDRDARAVLLAPFLGHHGRPVATAEDGRELFGGKGGNTERAARELVALMHELWQPCPLPPLTPLLLKRASWRLAGFAVLADWLGSSQDWFPYASPDLAPATYLACARRQARKAIAAAGIRPARPAKATGLAILDPTLTEPSDVQAWAERVRLPRGPFLALIEDVTGGGKTEAALVLAHRLLARGRARGLYLALPTMATANAMFGRLAESYRRLYEHDRTPSLALAHGATRLHEGFQAAIRIGDSSRAAEPESDEVARGDESGAACAAWLATEQRKAFLADVGIGTLDQALLGVLPAKYQSLRLFGLAERVLIVDEAHAYDAYMGRELEGLLAFQAGLGGSAIVLSATLPAVVKARLAAAFRHGLGLSPAPLGATAYPLATLLSAAAPIETPRLGRPDLGRTVTVERLPDAAAAVERIVVAAEARAAVAWICNTVDDALDAIRLLRDAGIDADLFHARFAMGHRLAIEQRVVARFGKHGDPARRPGVLVGTQVLEQSLDVDFDLIVTDLAPIDLLLQRMGRLWRHPDRPRPLPGPTLLVVSPEPVADPGRRWYEDAFPRAAWVYRHHGLLWLSARQLFGNGPSRMVRVPDQVRELVEAVYANEALETLPAAFERNSNEAAGNASAGRSHAGFNLLKLDAGYDDHHPGWDDESRVPTRLGDPTVTLRLACWDGNRLTPMCEDDDPKRAWALSEVTVRAHRAEKVPEVTGALKRAVKAAKEDWTRHDEGKLLLALEQRSDGSWAGSIIEPRGAVVGVSYTDRVGLVFSL